MRYSIRPDYTHGILNLANSILLYFGFTPYHQTLKELDDILAATEYRHIALIVCDAMGSINIDELLDKDSFLVKKRKAVISSVFPPTTAAATTTLISGLSPAQHGWIGWAPYLPDYGESVELFPNDVVDHLVVSTADSRAYITHTIRKLEKPVAPMLFEYKKISDLIAGNEIAETGEFAPFFPEGTENHVETFDELVNAVQKMSENSKKTYTYAYWPEPDSTMHSTGVTSPETRSSVHAINERLQQLSVSLENQYKAYPEYGRTLVIVTADHGHIDSENKSLESYGAILDTLTAVPSLEPRACVFNVKTDYKEDFPHLFRTYFSEEDFLLLDKDSFLKSNLFGPVTPEIPLFPKIEKMIGDYIAIAITNKSLFNSSKKAADHKGMHAGLTEKELAVPLIVF